MDFIVSDAMLEMGNRERLERLHHDMKTKDWFMALIDLEEFIECKEVCYQAYEDQKTWMQKSLVNIAKAGYFSSDRTIRQYEEEIWQTRD